MHSTGLDNALSDIEFKQENPDIKTKDIIENMESDVKVIPEEVEIESEEIKENNILDEFKIEDTPTPIQPKEEKKSIFSFDKKNLFK